MAANARAALAAQMPKLSPLTFERYFNFVGTATSIIGFIFVFVSIDKISNDAKMIVALTYLFLIIVFLVIYLLNITQARRYRYAQSVFHLHLVNHIIRDHLAALELGKKPDDLKETVRQILDAIAACYSVLTGRICRVCLKEVTTDLNVQTVARDSLSATTVGDQTLRTYCTPW